jgi:hypothetical protein
MVSYNKINKAAGYAALRRFSRMRLMVYKLAKIIPLCFARNDDGRCSMAEFKAA